MCVIGGLLVLAIAAFLAVLNLRVYNDRQIVGSEVKKLREQLQILQERRETIKAGLNAARGEGFQEEKMREQGYKKPGEEVIAILQDTTGSATKQNVNIPSDNFWLELWQKIKNLKP